MHLLKPGAYVGRFELHGPNLKSPFQNLEEAFAGREKLINGQKRGCEGGVLDFICTASDDP